MNPLLTVWTDRYGLPPFSAIEDVHFAPAFDAAFETAKADIAAIADNPEAPNFENTIEMLERSAEQLRNVASVFYSLTGADATPDREALQREISPRMAAHNSDVTSNPKLFARIKAVYETGDLTGQKARVAKLYYEDFSRAGAGLDEADRDRLKSIMQRLASLSTSFGQNVLADERSWFMELEDKDLDGLPASLIEAAQAAAKERAQGNYVITLNRSLIVPFLQFSARRDLRERAFAAWTSRGANGGETDNCAIVGEILQLRQERAQLLGFDSFAEFKLAPEMAKTPSAVRELLMSVWQPAVSQARSDADVLTNMLQNDGINAPLEPWDWRYYAEKRRLEEHDLDDAALKPYFTLDAMLLAAFETAHRLFGLSFSPIDAELYHKDVRAWEVKLGGRHMGLLIGDYFARPSKRSGAWCGRFRPQSRFDGDVRPLVTNVCNFAKAPGGAPTLLTFDDAETLFHEFGHALHHLLSDVDYPAISGTSVSRDFVELPSQLFEHWLSTPEILSKFARHVETNEPLPADIMKRLIAARNFDQGFATVEYVASALVDLDFHCGPPPLDPMVAQTKILKDLGLPHAITMRHATPHFQHVFTGDGYSSGYYSYMWAEVMDADAYRAFEEAGDPFDADTAKKLHDHIYSAGGRDEPEALYTEFRGAMPGVDALLEQRGLAST